MYVRYFLLWLPMVAIAFANATLRQLVLVRYFDELHAHQLSTITLMILCSVYVAIIFPFLKIQDAKQACLLGFGWAVLTIIFEFSLGFITERSWSELLQDYNILAGRIWILFLLSLFLLPYVVFVFRNKYHRVNKNLTG